MQAAIHEMIFFEIPLSGFGSQVATEQLAAIDGTILLFKAVNQFLDQGIGWFERFGG
jgi:hypothetical protein